MASVCMSHVSGGEGWPPSSPSLAERVPVWSVTLWGMEERGERFLSTGSNTSWSVDALPGSNTDPVNLREQDPLAPHLLWDETTCAHICSRMKLFHRQHIHH